MPEIRRKFDPEFREGLSGSSGRPRSRSRLVARDLDINAGTLGNWVDKDRAARGESEGLSAGDQAELKQLRAENAELRKERDGDSSDQWSCG